MSATIRFRRLNLWRVHWQSCEKCSRHLGTCCRNQCQSKPLSGVRKSPCWDLSFDDDVWLHEQATMNRVQNSFVDEQLAHIQSAHDEIRCYFADNRTMQIRPATTYDLSAESRICLLDLRDAPNREPEAIRQHIRNMQPYMLIAQYNDDIPNLAQFAQLSKGTGSDLGHQFGFAPICLDSSDRVLKLERISIFTSILRDELRKLQWNPPSHDSSGLVRRDGGTVLSSLVRSGPQES